MARRSFESTRRTTSMVRVSTSDWRPRSGCPGNRWPRVRGMTTCGGQLWLATFRCGWMMMVHVNRVWVTHYVDLAAPWCGRGSWDPTQSWHYSCGLLAWVLMHTAVSVVPAPTATFRTTSLQNMQEKRAEWQISWDTPLRTWEVQTLMVNMCETWDIWVGLTNVIHENAALND